MESKHFPLDHHANKKWGEVNNRQLIRNPLKKYLYKSSTWNLEVLLLRRLLKHQCLAEYTLNPLASEKRVAPGSISWQTVLL